MPKPNPRTGEHLLTLDVPTWLAQAVAPWRVETAALWRAGRVRLGLSSDRARIPVLMERSGATLGLAILDPKIPERAGVAFLRALRNNLARAAPLQAWLERLAATAELLEGGAEPPADADAELADLLAIWRAWPEREGDPNQPVPALPEGLAARVEARASSSRALRACLVHHALARGEAIDALTRWAALPDPDPDPAPVEAHLDGALLGLLGRRLEAIETLARFGADAPPEPDIQLALARAHEALDDHAGAATAHARVIALRGTAWDRLRLARSRQKLRADEPMPRADADSSDEERISFARQLVKVLDGAGRFDETLAVLAETLDSLAGAPPRDLVLRAARLHLWRVEIPEARGRLAALAEDDGEAQVIRGALAVLDGQPEAGLELLRAAEVSGPAHLERLAWQAEGHIARGQFEQAGACVSEHIMLENSLVTYLLKLHILAHTEPEQTAINARESRTFLDALVPEVLPSLRPLAEVEAACESPEGLAKLARVILDDMGGNRGTKPTWCRRDSSDARHLEPVAVRPSGREAAVAQLVRIRTEAPEQVLPGFEPVLAEYPTSPHPCTYRGELLIWLGRYRDALASFDEADARAPTRWSYVGRAAAYDLLGEAEQADHWTAAGHEKFGELVTATTHVYRGERLRKLEAWEDARRDLETALEYKPRRIGARINLALVHRALGEDEAWDRQVARLRADAPAYLYEAGVRSGQTIDEAALLRVLELMVGNRSSFLHTMIDGAGDFRVIPAPERWIGHARLSVDLGRRSVELSLARRLGL